ncbi:hypothetical protein ACFQJD_00060 [Haloplanus sp. GCM10025708]|uniref:hypothetical protein n=1 Tax=Haloplanus sp. GCM10025708 TaxID=3252679 RepID=UPI003617A46F
MSQNQLTGGLEEEYGAMSGKEGALPDAVQQLQGRIDRNAPGVSLTDTNQYNIVRRDGTLGVTFSASARQTMRRQTIQEVAEDGPAQGRTSAPDPSTVEDPTEVPGVVAGPDGAQVAPAIQDRRFEQQLAQELSASRADLKQRVASQVEGADPSDVETRIEDGQVVGSLDEDFERESARDRAAAQAYRRRMRAQRQQDGQGDIASGGQLGDLLLQPQTTSTTLGGIDRTLARAQARRSAKESLRNQGLDPSAFEITASATGDVQIDRREQFGDLDWSFGLGATATKSKGRLMRSRSRCKPEHRTSVKKCLAATSRGERRGGRPRGSRLRQSRRSLRPRNSERG